jgi:NADH-quinone oxidoreductase subunit M
VRHRDRFALGVPMNTLPILSILTLIPVLGAALLAIIPRERENLARKVALTAALTALATTIYLWMRYDPANVQMQFVERAAWVPTLGIEFHLGIDGLGLLMLILAAIVIPFAMLAAWRIGQNPKLYFALLLLLETGLFGTFTALNFFHWFIFWELSLLPAFFLIKLWGGPNRSRAAVQFFVYTIVGSVTMLLAFIAIHAATGVFGFEQLGDLARKGELNNLLFAKLGGGLFKTPSFLATALFLGVFLGFAVKVPLVPFHTWLPDAYSEAPTSTSMVLTGVMSKMGVYGFLRILLPIFPDQTRALATPLLWLAVATIVFSAFTAFAQRDLKRIVAYSSINHLGYCLLGIFAVVQLTGSNISGPLEKAAALNGVLLQMFNHGLTACALFYFVGILEQRTGGLRNVEDFGGLRKAAPVLCGLMGISLFASLGLPGLSSFVGEFLIFKGVFPLASAAAAVSTIGLLITAIFILTLVQRVFHGPLPSKFTSQTNHTAFADLTLTERLIAVPALALIFILGIYPQIALAITNPTVIQMLHRLS